MIAARPIARFMFLLAMLTACDGAKQQPGAKASPASPAGSLSAESPVSVTTEDDDEYVVLLGHGARIVLSFPVAVAALGERRGPKAEPWDLVTASMSSGTLANALVQARDGIAPAARPPQGRTLEEAGLRSVRRGPDTSSWVVRTGGVEFPLVDLAMFAVHASGNNLPIELVTEVVFDGTGSFPGARETMLTISAPLTKALPPDALTASYQTVVASNLDGEPRWIENAYTREGISWRQRVYWATRDNIMVRYQAPADRRAEQEKLRAAAETLVRTVHVVR